MGALTIITSLLTQLLSLVPAGTALYNQYAAQKAQAEQWAADGHVPTDAEWDALDAQVRALEAQIDQAAQS
jgi:hypothetical protein